MKLLAILFVVLLVGCGKKQYTEDETKDTLLLYKSSIDEYGVVCYSAVGGSLRVSCVKVR